MFSHLYSFRMKALLRDRGTVFWTLLFPILLATFFHFAFGNLVSGTEAFSPVPVAVVNDEAYQSNDNFRQILDSVSTGDDRLFDLTVTTQEDADNLLKTGKTDGTINVSDTIGLTVKESGLNQSIIRSFLDQYTQTAQTYTNILQSNPSAFPQLMASLSDQHQFVTETTLSGAAPDIMLNYFYALIAMACLYGCFWGLRNTTDIQANLSEIGKRRCIAPSHKMKAIVTDELAALTIQFGEVLIVLAYLILVLKVNFGSQIGYVVLTCLIGSITGVSYGTFVGSVIQKKEALKNAFLIAFTLILCFLSGLMIANMKDIIAHNAPIINYINPAALITDSFYSLYVYQTHTHFFLNFTILCIESFLFAFGSYLLVRRQKYASL